MVLANHLTSEMAEDSTKNIQFDIGITTGPHGISIVPGLRQLHKTIQDDVVNELDEMGGVPGEGGAVILLFFVLSHAAIEHRSIELLYHNLIDSEFHGNNSKEFLRDGMSQKQRQDLLLRTGIIPGHVHSYIDTARITRNKVAHHPHQHFIPEFDNLSDKAEQTMKGVEELEEMVVDISLPEDMK